MTRPVAATPRAWRMQRKTRRSCSPSSTTSPSCRPSPTSSASRRAGFYCYGSSWGAILSEEFAVTRPKGLRGLILDGVFTDAQVYIKTQWRDRVSTLPLATQKKMRWLEDTKAYKNPVYEVLDDRLFCEFTCRTSPVPQCIKDAKKGVNEGIYEGMQGASEFTIGGVLEHWTITDRLHVVRVPTLVLAGQFDTMTEECSQMAVDNIPTAWPLVMIPRSGHCKTVDEPLAVCDWVRRFILTCESSRVSRL
eukprot:NODE_2454_length_931_cov_412.590183.p1 GENE.NODE_2454_length_931_cov_412.590183~~NODE_2454_length_931_cov_412.590183.p1  ORF type:complete len:249 (-),score=36.83 NODE_2454_length_931_cov_412.590183:75-821(-)